MTRAASAFLWVMLIGCKSGAPSQPDATAPASEPAAAPAGKVACHLDCSGQERTAYGDDEEQARAAARELVGETCRPEDGQFFIVCDPPASE